MKEPNWNDINFKKESSMAWLNSANCASVIVGAIIQKTAKWDNHEMMDLWKFFRDEIYKLNMVRIDHDAASAVSGEDMEP